MVKRIFTGIFRNSFFYWLFNYSFEGKIMRTKRPIKRINDVEEMVTKSIFYPKRVHSELLVLAAKKGLNLNAYIMEILEGKVGKG
jgi:hypothetical protein